MNIKQMLLVGATLSGTAALAQTPLKSVFALPGVNEKVSAELVVRESGPLTRELLIAFTDKATGRPITDFEEELTQQLHVLATDSDFSSFVHEHGGKPGADGRFSVVMRFPKPGTYHVYADAMPKGLGQQVVRFEVPVAGAAAATAAPQVKPNAAQGSDGPYAVKLDASALRVGQESMMNLTVLKNGKPATDLGLYLGVAAHAVFVNTADLGYVHAHAMAADTAKGGHGAHASHGAPTTAASGQMMLHATPPHAGRYALWIQFKGGNQVRTVPFVVDVPAAP